MSRTVTALYDTRAEAEAARQRLDAEVDLGSARILDQQSHASGGPDGSLNRVPLSHEDRPTFHEGIRRGGFMLTAEVRSHEDADKIIRLLEESASVDLDRRLEQWRSDGWSPSPAAQPNRAAQPRGEGQSEEVIPIVEEELAVGRREVERGGARVRSYVREVPAHEEVTLREEHVSVERRPVDQPVDAADLEGDLLRERDVEVTAKAEEAVVSKEAHVREEVVVTKVEERRVEQVEDQVARTEVDLDQGRTASPARVDTHDTTSSSLPPAVAASFPIGGAANPVPQPRAVERSDFAETGGFEEAAAAYQPPRETIVAERRESNRPSAALVIGSAVAGAIAGSVIPFMLAGRKSSRTREVMLIEDHSPSREIGVTSNLPPARRTTERGPRA